MNEPRARPPAARPALGGSLSRADSGPRAGNPGAAGRGGAGGRGAPGLGAGGRRGAPGLGTGGRGTPGAAPGGARAGARPLPIRSGHLAIGWGSGVGFGGGAGGNRLLLSVCARARVCDFI